ncbi:MAG: PadR family transcriptional regulator [Eubacteriaceae bacterium]
MIKTIRSDLIRGHTDTIILSLLTEKDMYGYEICKTISHRSNSLYELKEATLYSSFRRLEKSELIKSYWGDVTKGGRRKYYSITEMGTLEFFKLRDEWKFAKSIIDMFVLEGENNE